MGPPRTGSSEPREGADLILSVVLWRSQKAAKMSAGNNNGKKVFGIKPNVEAYAIILWTGAN